MDTLSSAKNSHGSKKALANPIYFSFSRVMNSKYINVLTDLFFTSFACWVIAYVLVFFLGFSFASLAIVGFVFVVIGDSLLLLQCAKDQSLEKISIKELIILVFFICVAVFLTLCLKRPDADDRLYLSVAISVLEYTEVAFKNIPLFHKHLHVILPYDLAKSCVTYITGIPILVSYYLIVPVFVSIFVVIVNYQLLKLLIGHDWVIGLMFFFVIMLAWGDVHRTYANFGFVRIFQGKAALVSVVIPAIFLYYLKFVETFNKKYILLLSASMVAGCGFTATGIVVCPLILTILFVSSIVENINFVKEHSLLMLCLVIPVIFGLMMYFYFGIQRSGVHTLQGVQQHTTNLEMIQMVFGDGYRGIFALVCFAISPFFVGTSKVKIVYRNFVVICLILLLLPQTSEVIAQMTYPTLSWRWLWILPIPFSMSVVVGRLGGIQWGTIRCMKGNLSLRHVIALLLTIIFIVNDKPLVVSEENQRTSLTWPSPKIAKRKIWLRLHEEFGEVQGYRIYVKSAEKYF